MSGVQSTTGRTYQRFEILMRMEPDRWIETEGGPLVCIERCFAHLWSGLNRSTSGGSSDYDRACAIKDYVGVLDIGPAQALVLGDMPLSTSIWNDANGEKYIYIVRCVYTNSDEIVKKIIEDHKYLDFSDPLEIISIHFSTRNIVMFDSAFTGINKEDYIAFECPFNHVHVDTKLIAVDQIASLVVHRLRA
jgi:hypothetical protein